jgi:dihydrofolate reductase
VTITVFNSLTLDGVMQSPGRADEDTRGGFEHGGWAVPYSHEVLHRRASQGTPDTGALLLGRRTYEDFAAYWPNQSGNPFTDILNNAQKYVASRTLTEPLPWQNSTLLEGDAVEAVATLKEGLGKDIVILGSGELIRSLMPHGLIDEFILLIHPLVLGAGRRLFPAEGPRADMRLVDSVVAPTGVVMATYRAA